MKVYHYIIANPYYERMGDTSTRREYVPRRGEKIPDGWKKIAVCGYHEVEAKEPPVRKMGGRFAYDDLERLIGQINEAEDMLLAAYWDVSDTFGAKDIEKRLDKILGDVHNYKEFLLEKSRNKFHH